MHLPLFSSLAIALAVFSHLASATPDENAADSANIPCMGVSDLLDNHDLPSKRYSLTNTSERQELPVHLVLSTFSLLWWGMFFLFSSISYCYPLNTWLTLFGLIRSVAILEKDKITRWSVFIKA